MLAPGELDTPSIWRVPLRFERHASPTLGGVHGLASNWLDDDQSHRDPVKGWSVRWPTRSADGLDLVVSTLGSATATRFLARAQSGSSVRLGPVSGQVRRSPELLANRPWFAFERPVPAFAWTIEFLSPTTFRRGNVFHALPAPDTILNGLARSWASFAPPGLHVQVETASTWVSDISGESVPIKTSQRSGVDRRPVSLSIAGFVGKIRLQCAPESALGVGRLLGWAEFAGVGAWTTRGLGAVQVSPS